MDNYFRDRKEIEDFFINECFEFLFMADNIIYFNTLRPIFLGDEMFSFQISFYYGDGETFFRFSSFDDWLDGFQLSEVVKISEENNERETLYFMPYETT